MKKSLIFTPLFFLSIPLLSLANQWIMVDADKLWEEAELAGGTMLEGLLYLAGAIFVVLIMLSGMRMMLGKDQDDKKSAKNLMIFSFLALIVLLSFKIIFDLLVSIFSPLK